MSSLCLAGFLALVTFPLALNAQQPSLADLAKRERARRATITTPARIYTNDDLQGGAPLTTAARTTVLDADDGAPTAATVSDPGEASAEDLEPRDETYWRDRITTARADKRRAELNAAALQNRVDGLWAAFTARDDPIQRAQIERDRNAAIDGLQNARDELERLDQEIRDIQEEARRASVPPGWLR